MRALFLQRQPCIRALKYAVALRAAVPGFTLGFAYQGRTLSAYYGSGDELFDSWWDLGNAPVPAQAFRRVLDEFVPDIVHSHNLPDSLTVMALDTLDGAIPVVHDIHDLQSLRRTPYRDGFPEPDDPRALEQQAIERSDAVITVSAELAELVDAAYARTSPTIVIPNLALRRDLPDLRDAVPGARAVVYQGSLTTDGGHYDLRRIFATIARTGTELHVHPTRHLHEYRDLARTLTGMHVHMPLKPRDLVRQLTGYAAGWTGFNSALNNAHLETVLPNKLFEYLGAGLPVLTLRGHRALTRFVDQEGVGFVLDNPSQVTEVMQSPRLSRLREHVVATRTRYTFEERIGPVVDLYRSLVAALPAAAPSPHSG